MSKDTEEVRTMTKFQVVILVFVHRWICGSDILTRRRGATFFTTPAQVSFQPHSEPFLPFDSNITRVEIYVI